MFFWGDEEAKKKKLLLEKKAKEEQKRIAQQRKAEKRRKEKAALYRKRQSELSYNQPNFYSQEQQEVPHHTQPLDRVGLGGSKASHRTPLGSSSTRSGGGSSLVGGLRFGR